MAVVAGADIPSIVDAAVLPTLTRTPVCQVFPVQVGPPEVFAETLIVNPAEDWPIRPG